ncbi:dual specificity protein phosphatase 22-B-like isoform X2 [Corythoichthys intestinalis]|uniref:dual specificity protein phosphatase 22-B-like isoform X2 n=1 Tax=Corythoichthys intestinalis TaxID=161448 RepID=UPI0025A63114|nr:dual specificity protein phosphatase 22-B-like isoform X2 [Corythoichthys intestinalis]
MGNGINKVLPDLYLGNLKDARDKDLLMQHNITHILSIHDTAAPVLEDMTYLCIAAADHRKQNLVAGVSRSVTLVVAYIMTVTGRGWVESLAAVRAARPCAGPNLGFLRQLDEFENTELKEYRTWWKNQYGMHPLHSNDEEEVEKLLMQRFKGNDLPTIITKSLVTSGT